MFRSRKYDRLIFSSCSTTSTAGNFFNFAKPVLTKVTPYFSPVRYFRTEESKESVREIPVGSVMATTELTYEYGVRKKPKKSSTSPPEGAAVATDTKTPPTLQLDGKPHLPFQLQVEYTSKDGSRLMRVITDANPITRDRGMAEKGGSNQFIIKLTAPTKIKNPYLCDTL